MSKKAIHGHGKRSEDMTHREYLAEVIKADEQRAKAAYWLALCNSPPVPDDLADMESFKRWTCAVNKRYAESLARLQ